MVLPDDVKGFSHNGSPIEFGVAAVDELGNESDLATFKASYQFNIPLAPEGMWIENLDEFHIQSEEPQEENSQEPKKNSAESGSSKDASEVPAAPAEAKDGTGIYPSAQLYNDLMDEW